MMIFATASSRQSEDGERLIGRAVAPHQRFDPPRQPHELGKIVTQDQAL